MTVERQLTEDSNTISRVAEMSRKKIKRGCAALRRDGAARAGLPWEARSRGRASNDTPQRASHHTLIRRSGPGAVHPRLPRRPIVPLAATAS
jgi:hypothetical protein